ncbi:hypothetical protein BGZ65_008964, partial [Modicella reniformis]
NADVIIYGDMATLVLEIINSTLTHKLKVSEANIKAPTPDETAQVIQTTSRTWPPNLTKVFPDIKFECENEEKSSEFFCPYVVTDLSEYIRILG